MRKTLALLGLVAGIALSAAASDQKPPPAAKKGKATTNEGERLSTFTDGRHGRGELRHEQGLSVVTLRGTPAQMGEQFGVLAVKAAPGLDAFHQNFVTDAGIGSTEPLVRLLALKLQTGLSADHRAELDAMCAASRRGIDLAMFANTVYDLSSTMGCSTVVVEPGRSVTGTPVMGRNFDWLPTRGMREHTLLVVGHPAGKRSFAIVTVPPILGCISGINDAGLCCTVNEIHLPQSADKPTFQWDGVPMLFAFRRVLEECGTVAEAEALLRGMTRTTTACLTVCDAKGGAVFEITPKSIEVRRAVNGVVCCTKPLPQRRARQADAVLAVRQTRPALRTVGQARRARGVRATRRGEPGQVHAAVDSLRAGRAEVAPEGRRGTGDEARRAGVRRGEDAGREVADAAGERPA